MRLRPDLRRFTFAAHITSSIGWIGAVLVFLAFAGVAFTSPDEATVRGAYLVMVPAAWFVLVPLAHAALATGIVLSVGTQWGLLRHYWVVLKLGITVFCTVILMIYMGTFRQIAGVAADQHVGLESVRNASPLVHAILALILLLVTTALGVYKPFGLTPYGARRQMTTDTNPRSAGSEQPRLSSATTGSFIPLLGAVIFVMLALVIIHRLMSHGMHGH